VATPAIMEATTNTATPGTGYASTVTTSALSAGTDQLYLLFIGIRDASDWGAASVTGGGLTWTKQLHAYDTQLTLVFELWTAYGSPAGSVTPTVGGFSIQSGTIDTNLAGVNLIAARVDGTSGSVANVASSDTGATDTSSASVTATVSNTDSLILNCLVTRNFTVSAVDADYTLVTETTNGTAGNVLFTRLYERNSSPAAGTDTITHTLNAVADWIMACVELGEAVAPPGGTDSLLLMGA
jgi:hypothetical protein